MIASSRDRPSRETVKIFLLAPAWLAKRKPEWNPNSDSSIASNPLSCSPFQGAGTRICSLALASVAAGWLLLGKAGGTVNETTVDHALIRGLVTAGPDASRSCLGLGTSVGWMFRLLVESRVLLP